MSVRGIVWVGTRTANHGDTVRFFKDALGLELSSQQQDFAILHCPNGDTVEVFGPSDEDHKFFATGPVPAFLVDDVEETKNELEAAGAKFLAPL